MVGNSACTPVFFAYSSIFAPKCNKETSSTARFTTNTGESCKMSNQTAAATNTKIANVFNLNAGTIDLRLKSIVLEFVLTFVKGMLRSMMFNSALFAPCLLVFALTTSLFSTFTYLSVLLSSVSIANMPLFTTSPYQSEAFSFVFT